MWLFRLLFFAHPRSTEFVELPPRSVHLAMQQTRRPWLSLWVTIHFFIVTICLLNNAGGSQLLSRLVRAVAPYSIALHQDYGGLPLGMTSGEELDKQCLVEIHLAGDPPQQWHIAQPTTSSLWGTIDRRAANLEHMISIAGADKNEEILGLLFDTALHQSPGQVDRIRLRRVAAATFQQASLSSSGELPPGSIQDTTLFECTVIELSGGVKRLLPVLDKVRRAQTAGAAN